MILLRPVTSKLASPFLRSPAFVPWGPAAAASLRAGRGELVAAGPKSLSALLFQGTSARGGGAPDQQIRFRWTKAKKKRHERYHRRQEMAAKGEELPKPPYYFPIATPVVNAVPKQQRIQQAKDLDVLAAEELRSRLRDVETRSPVVLRHHMGDNVNQMSDKVRRLLELNNGSQSEVVRAQKSRAMQLFEKRPGDTGSSAVQVVALTNRIQQLTTHFQKHHKDKHGKRGLAALYVRRRKLLDYMERKDFDSYRKVVNTLGLVR